MILRTCSEDVVKLWADPTVKELLDIEKMRPEEMAGLCVVLVSFGFIVDPA